MSRKKRRRRPRTPLCPECRINRPFREGPCPPCLRRLGKEAPTESPPAPRHSGPLTYAERQHILGLMGFKTYDLYLKSYLWKKIRVQVFETHGRRCWICRKRGTATQVHHEYYTAQNLSGDTVSGLRTICPSCHHLIEYTNGEKLTGRQSRRKSSMLRKGPVKRRKKRASRNREKIRPAVYEMEREFNRLMNRD